MKNITLTIILLSCGLLVSCMKWGGSDNSRLMQQAQSIVEQMPDSALTLLEAMNTLVFSKAERAEYNLLRIQARKDAGMDLSSENEIFEVRDYFFHRKDTQKASMACYLAAWVSAQNNPPQAMVYFQEAFDFAGKGDNMVLQAKILYNMGYLNYLNGWFDDAMKRYLHALKIIQLINHQYQLKIKTLNEIANTLLMKNKVDSAHHYYRLALSEAQQHGDSVLQARVYSNMGVTYREQGELEKAIYCSRQSLLLAVSDDQMMYIFLNLAEVYHEMNRVDSARYYLQLAENLFDRSENIFTSASLADLSYQIEKSAGNYQKSLEYLKKNSDLQIEIMENNDRKLLLEMQRKYDLTNKENELTKQKIKTWKITGLALAILLALAIALILTLRRYMKHKEDLAKEKIKMAEKQLALEQAERINLEKTMELEHAQFQAQTLQEMYCQRDNEMKTKFLERIGILKKIALPFTLLDKKKLEKDTELSSKLAKETLDIVKNLDRQEFMNIANELYPGFTGWLKQNYHRLDEREISICCMLLFDFNNQELDLFINRRAKGSLNTIQTWKSTIRQKLNLDPYSNIKEFLIEKISRNSFLNTDDADNADFR